MTKLKTKPKAAPKEPTHLHMKVGEDLMIDLKKEAQREERTVAGMVRKVLTDYLAAQKKRRERDE